MSDLGEWRHQLPVGWDLVPLKAAASYWVSSVDKIPSEDEQPVRLCNYTDVYKNEFITPALPLMDATATEHEIAQFRLLKDDVVITKDSESWDDIAVPALVTETADDLVCGYHLAIIRPQPNKLSGRFLFRCLQSRSIRVQLELESKGVTRFGLPKDAIGKLLLPLPAVDVQESIAAFLDTETTYIDALIAEKEQMLRILTRKREAMISNVVTRGLDPNVRMKPSGLEWLGEVPEHWEVMQLKRSWMTSDYGISEDIRGDGSVKVLRMSCIVDGRIDLSNAGQVDAVDPTLLLRKGDLLFNRTNSLDQVAKVGLLDYDPDMPTSFASYLVRIRVNDRTRPQYLTELLNSDEFLRYARGNAIAAISQANLSPSRYGDMLIVLPPTSEQEQIVARLTEERNKTLKLGADLRSSLSLLKERRSALITAAVTGQLHSEEIPA